MGRTDIARLLERLGSFGLWFARCRRGGRPPAGPAINPPFDARFFAGSQHAAPCLFYLQKPLSPGRGAGNAWADALSREIVRTAPCHRDYHGNNLFPLEDGVAWIDFQDLRSGPDSYDIASLLWERTTLDWMSEDLAASVIESFAKARKIDASDLRSRFDRVLLQRAWKVCGTFARAVAQGRGEGYRRYLPGEFALVRRLLGDTPEERAFRRVFDERLSEQIG
jgi:hypothetical protein